MAPKRLLVVEDHDPTRVALSRIFRSEGYEVTTAATVAEAMTQLNPPPECMVLDLILPDGPGEQVLRRIRAHNLPTLVTVCTGASDAERLTAVRRLNPVALLTKPIQLDDMAHLYQGRIAQRPSTDCWIGTHPRSRTRRRFERVSFFARVTVTAFPRGGTFETRSIDVSLGGIGLICPQPLPTGQLVSLSVHVIIPSGPTSEQVPGRVASVRFDADSAVMGIEFDEVLSERLTPALVQAIEKL